MSDIFFKLTTDLVQARRDKSGPKLKLLQTLIGAIEQQKSKNTGKKVLTVDELTFATILSFKKNIQEFLEVVVNETTKNELQFELKTLESYLPKQLSVCEMQSIILLNNLDTVPAGMQFFIKNYANQYDSKVLATLLKK